MQGPSSFPGTMLGKELQSRSLSGPRLNTPTPGVEPRSYGEAGLDQPFEQEAGHPAGDQGRKPGQQGRPKRYVLCGFLKSKEARCASRALSWHVQDQRREL